jgi:hypothetical protein
MATKKGVVLERSWGFTKAEARETLRNLRRAGLVPADVDVEFVTCGGGGLAFGSRAVLSRTAGRRFAFRERQEVRR